MSRKNQIEGQLNFLDMLMAEAVVGEASEVVSEDDKESVLAQEFSTGQLSEKRKIDKKQKKFTPGAFAECISCWCSTCEHSTVGGSVPRPFGESTRPCPSCELCVSEGKADVCVIGSAEEGCRYRAEKEGLVE